MGRESQHGITAWQYLDRQTFLLLALTLETDWSLKQYHWSSEKDLVNNTATLSGQGKATMAELYLM